MSPCVVQTHRPGIVLVDGRATGGSQLVNGLDDTASAGPTQRRIRHSQHAEQLATVDGVAERILDRPWDWNLVSIKI